MCCACSKGALLSLGAGCDALFASSATAVSSLVLRFRNNTGVFRTISHAKTTGPPSPNWRGYCSAQHLGNCYRYFWSHVTDQQLCLERAAPSVLKDHLGLDRHAVIRAIQGLNERRVFLSYKAASDFPGTGQLAIIRVEFFMQDEKAADLGPRHLWVVCQTRVHTRNFLLDEIVDLWPSGKISIARVGQSMALGPVTYRPEVDIDEGPDKGPLLAIHHRFFDERTEFEFVFKIAWGKQGAVGIAHPTHVPGAVDDFEMPIRVDVASIARMDPAIFERLYRGLRILVIAQKDARAAKQHLTLRADFDLHLRHRRAD